MEASFSLNLAGRVTDRDITKLMGGPRSPLNPYLHRIGRRVSSAAQRQVGVRTGDLQASIHYRVEIVSGLPGVWVGTHNRIARIHHEGSLPHIITPNKVKVLRFTKNGRVIFTKEVKHPGTKPNRFLTDNIYLAKI